MVRGKVSLKTDVEPPLDQSVDASIPAAPETGHVLLADADDRARARRGSQLRTAGFRVSVARTGFETIVKATCHIPDVILVGESLPDLDAAETGRLIATCPVTSHIPVVPFSSGRGLARRVLTVLRQRER